MSARKNPRTRRATKAEVEGLQAGVETTTSQTDADRTPVSVKKASKGRKKATQKSASKPKRTGRPRVSQTETERVTLRVEKDQLFVIDTLVKLKKYSNRSEALRAAIKEFTDDQLDQVDDFTAQHEKRLKLMQLAALQDQMDELSGA